MRKFLLLILFLAVAILAGVWFKISRSPSLNQPSSREGTSPSERATAPPRNTSNFLSGSPPASLTAPAAGQITPVYLDPPANERQEDVENVQAMLRNYRTVLGENPVGTNAEIMRALKGGNSKQINVGPPDRQQLNEKGELIDHWGTPYFFHQLAKDHMEIRSAGPDRIMWTEDDVLAK